MTAVVTSGNSGVATPACADSSCPLHTIIQEQQQLQLHARSLSYRVLEPRLLLAAPLLLVLLLLSPPPCTTTGHTRGVTVFLPSLLPHPCCTCEALMLRRDSSRCGGDYSGGSTSNGSVSSIVIPHRQVAFMPHNFMLRRTSDTLPTLGPRSSNSSPCDTSSSTSCSGIARAAGGIEHSRRSSPTSCHAFRLTFGKEEEPGRVALVTGASRGIGKTIAETLAEGGVSHVLCVARNQDACDQVAADLVARGFSASGHGVDVGDAAAVERLCSTLLEKYPRIDILVNNAGITRDNLFIRMTPQEWSEVINVNLNSAFYFTSPLIKRMVKNKFGRIINMASVVGVGGNVGQANYAASKAGLIGMTRSLGKEYASRGITVNAVAPGFIRSAMTDAMTDTAKVANVVAFLASDQAAYVTGKVLPVDGGVLFGGN